MRRLARLMPLVTMRTPGRPSSRRSGRPRALDLLAGVGAVAIASAGCGSSSSGSGGGTSDSGFGFGGDDSGGGDAGHGKKDSGSGGKDSGSRPPLVDAACGTALGSTWCQQNAPMLSESSNVLCDDFDVGTLSSVYGYIGVSPASYVGTHYVSPYCGLHAFIGDGGGYGSDAGFAPIGSFTEHAYTLVSGAAAATLAFDLFVPSSSSKSACEGAVVARLAIEGSDGTRTDAATLWLTISNVDGATDGGAGYTATLSGQVATGADGGTVATATTVVTPRAADHGWARLEINATAYSILKNPATISGTASWSSPTAKAQSGTSSAVSASGSLLAPTGSAAALFDVGVIGNPATGVAPGGCDVFVDNFVSNVVTN